MLTQLFRFAAPLGWGSLLGTVACYLLSFAFVSNILTAFTLQHSCCCASLTGHRVQVLAVDYSKRGLLSSKDLDVKVAYGCFSLVKVLDSQMLCSDS